MKTVRIETLGCRLNQIESESAARYFLDNGFKVDMSPVSAKSQEDGETILCIVNTCTVTQKSEQKARRIIRLLTKKYQNASILVTGCYAQLAEEEIKKIDSCICVLKGQVKSRIAEIPIILKEESEKNTWNKIDFSKLITQKICSRMQEKNLFAENSFKLSTSSFIAHSRASLKIQEGCNNNCSYCAIHMARGNSVSLDASTAIQRVQELENAGQSEVVITTVNIGHYRSEYKGKIIKFAELLKLMLENTISINFRISSLYPEIVDDEFCEIIKNERVCPHFHISVQSGSDSILRAMNRTYEAATVINACDKLRAAKNNPFIACDIITGFPGETDKDFELTMELCNRCDFAWVHAFPYSERPGTPAASMKNKIPQSISGERAKRLTDWAINNKINYVNSFSGKELCAILETVRNPRGVLQNSSNFVYHAVTNNFIHCEIVSTSQMPVNKAVKIKIEKALPERICKGGEIEASAIFL